MEMPADEFLKWERHLRYYPLPGLYEQHLLASLIAVQINSKEKKYSVYDIAPWLKTPEVEKALDEKKTKEDVEEASSMYEQIKKRKKDGN